MPSAGRGAGGRFAAGNIFGSSRLGYAVGDPAFLESEQSKAGKYFRSIEFGTQGFVGRILAGAWGFGPRGARINEEATPFGPRGEQVFIPFAATLEGADLMLGAQRARRYLTKLGFKGSATGEVGPRGGRQRFSGPAVRGVVRHEIVAMDAYAKAAAAFQPAARELEAIKQAFLESGLTLEKDVKGRRTPTKAASAAFVGRTGLLAGHATSAGGLSLAKIDKTFQSELTNANRLLAEALAGEVALEQRDLTKRKASSTGFLEESTLDRRNRFPN